MNRQRLRILKAMLRYLREYDDIPAREVSKRIAANTALLMVEGRGDERPCRLPLRELWKLQKA